jgi:hypothetical protein
MITGNDSRRLIELAFDCVSAETEQQTKQAHDQAAELATEIAAFNVWLDLIDYIKEWNSNGEHKYPITRTTALRFFLTRQHYRKSN